MVELTDKSAKKVVCVVTSTRADYGILSRFIRGIHECSELELRLAVTGSHLSEKFGMTVDEIRGDGIPIDVCIPILGDDSGKLSVTDCMARAISGFGEYFADRRPDMVVVLGDRYEICAVCLAAVEARIPLAHIHGGETTEGAWDECFRHSITKMSYLHFTACDEYRKRVIQLGEAPERVFNVGAMGVENAKKLKKLTQDELTEQVGFDFHKPYAVVTFHPVTLENSTEREQCAELFAALDRFPQLGFVITKANADTGGTSINAAIDEYAAMRPNCKSVFSLGALRYLSALQYTQVVIGNSSSGIMEVPAFGIPTVNIGDRQKGRLRADSVIDCPPDRESIEAAIKKALSAEFRDFAKGVKNPFGGGDTADDIIRSIKDYLLNEKIDLKKRFFDVDFEVK